VIETTNSRQEDASGEKSLGDHPTKFAGLHKGRGKDGGGRKRGCGADKTERRGLGQVGGGEEGRRLEGMEENTRELRGDGEAVVGWDNKETGRER